MSSKQGKTSSGKVWLFRFLVLIGLGIFVAAWLLPWWNMNVEQFESNAVQIRPWGLTFGQSTGTMGIMMKGAELPIWFPYIMWTYFALCLIVVLVSLFIRLPDMRIGKIKLTLNQFLIGGVGFSFIFAGVFAAVYAGGRMKKSFDVPLQGRVYLDMGDPFVAFVNTRLRTWLVSALCCRGNAADPGNIPQ